MKRLVAISAVLALIAGSAFAVDLTGSVASDYNLFTGQSGQGASNVLTTSGAISGIALEGSGANDDGDFGGWLRVKNNGGFPGGQGSGWGDNTRWGGYAWWRPVDPILIRLGVNPDGMFGFDSFTGWNFYNKGSDRAVTMGGGVIWGGGYGNYGQKFRDAITDGYDYNALALVITPVDQVAINIAIPFGANAVAKDDGTPGVANESKYVIIQSFAQLDLKLDAIGRIVLSYDGKDATMKGNSQPQVSLFYRNTFGPVDVDFGLGMRFPSETVIANDSKNNPINAALGLKFATGAFGFKFRTLGTFLNADKSLKFYGEILPYYNVTDVVRAYLAAGMQMVKYDQADAFYNWHVNPFVRVGPGADWGNPHFWAGIKLSSFQTTYNGADPAQINWSVPIGVNVAF